MPIHKDIKAYNAAQAPADKRICNALAKQIAAGLPDAENKIWHRHPVWFLEGNPIVGYSKLKDCVRLLFWSGQSFDEPGLKPEGTFKAAEARYTSHDQIDARDLASWLNNSIEIQWDYKNIVKRKGKLERLTSNVRKNDGASKKPTSGSAKTKTALGDWRSAMLAQIREIIIDADPDVVEEVKWRKPSNPAGVPVWEHAGIICTCETYKNAVKVTFPKGASLEDPSGVFNSSLDGNARRAIDYHEGEKINAKAFKDLIRAAVALNTSAPNKSPRSTVRPTRAPKAAKKT